MDIDIFKTDKKYNIIYADPPWSYQNWCDKKNGAAKAHYETMTQADIEALPVKNLAAEIVEAKRLGIPVFYRDGKEGVKT